MRALIALTIFMGVLIIAGLAVIVVTILHRMSVPKPALPMVLVAGPATPGHAAVALPPGALLKSMSAVGDRLVLDVGTSDGRDTLMTLDPLTGTVLETIDLVPGTSPSSSQTPAEGK